MDHPGHALSTTTKKEKGNAPSRAKNCQECRRLKIKCDRNVPCANCVKRGTSSICPDGQLMSKGHRLLFSNTEDLHAKIDELTSRIEELEDALATLQALHSDEPHPLLGTVKQEEEEHLISSFGSLRLHEDGTKRFYGPTSSVEWIMSPQTDLKPDSHEINDLATSHRATSEAGGTSAAHPLRALPTLVYIDANFPQPADDSAIDTVALRNEIVGKLPSKEVAIALINSYYDRGSWEVNPILRTELFTEHFVDIYDHGLASTKLQSVGLLYGVFANGLLHDTSYPDNENVAAEYMTLSRACCTVDSIISNTTLTAIKTMLLHISYYHSSDVPYRAAKAEATMGMTMQLAVSLGLHRDPSMWNLPAEEAASRRRTMWELITSNLWTALISGRPPILTRRFVDVKLQFGTPDVADPDPNFNRGKHHFSHTILWELLDIGVAHATKASYGAVMKLDAKIRKWRLPPELSAPDGEITDKNRVMYNIREGTGIIFREVSLLCLHRSYFARALLEPPFDPLNSAYSRSVLAAYASACAVIRGFRALYEREPIAILKYAFFWTQGFSAAVVLASIAMRAPDCPIAKTGMAEFDSLFEVFEREKDQPRASGFATLLRLKTQAEESMSDFQEGRWKRPTTTDQQLLLGLGGAGEVVKLSKPQTSPSATSHSSPSSTDDIMSSLGDMQPSLDDYLRSWDQNPAMGQKMYTKAPISDVFLYGVVNAYGNQVAHAQQEGFNQLPMDAPQVVPEAGYQTFENMYPQPNVQISAQVPSIDFSQPPATNPSQGQLGATTQGNQDQNTAYLWDNFLWELGIPRTD